MGSDFNLDLPGLKVTNTVEYPEEGFVLVAAEPVVKSNMNPECPKCHQRVTVWKNGFTYLEVVDARHFGERVRIDIKIPRYRCQNPMCDGKSNFQEDLSGIVDAKHHVTLRLRDLIMEMCAQRTNFSYIADYFGLEEETVAAIFYEQAAKYMEKREIELPRYIGVDEVHLAKDMRFVLFDVEEGQVRLLDMLEQRTQPKVEQYLSALPEDQRNAVQCVAMDMWRPYRTLAQKYFPNAKVVVDLFHITKAVNKIMNDARNDINAAEKKWAREHNATPRYDLGDAFLLMRKNSEDLIVNDDLDEKEKLNAVFTMSKELETVYMLKETLRDIFKWETDESGRKTGRSAIDRETAEAKLIAWRNSIPAPPKVEKPADNPSKRGRKKKVAQPDDLYADFRTLAQTLLVDWHDEVLNFFDFNNPRVSNGPSESMNNQIQKWYKAGSAAGFDNFRTRALYILDHEYKRKMSRRDLSKPYKTSVAERRKALRAKE